MAEAKLDSWDTFVEQQEAQIAEVSDRLGSVKIHAGEKVVSPQSQIT